MTLRDLAIEDLLLHLRPVNRALRAAADRRARASARLDELELTDVFVGEDHVALLLDDLDAQVDQDAPDDAPAIAFTDDEAAARQILQARAADLGLALPLDRIATALHLSPFELEAVLLCAAPAIDIAYERVYAFIVDDMSRTAPCAELLCHLTASDPAVRLARRAALGPHQVLRRRGLLVAGPGVDGSLRQAFGLGPATLDVLTGAVATLDRFADPGHVDVPDDAPVPPDVDADALDALARGLATGRAGVVGVWGHRAASIDDAVIALASRAGAPLRRLRLDGDADLRDAAVAIDAALAAAEADWALLWIELDGAPDAVSAVAVDAVVRSAIPVCLSGVEPRRPTALLAARDYAELVLDEPAAPARAGFWRDAFGDDAPAGVSPVAQRFRLSAGEVAAVHRVARTRARLDGNGAPAPLGDRIEAAANLVVRKQPARMTAAVVPRRTLDDVVLSPALAAQLRELIELARAEAVIRTAWGFDEHVAGDGARGALFTGESGTGKTLAAEVTANALGVPLLRVDLARAVSKWVGETEKNIDVAFREAEDSHAVLLFDEAEALFGKRADVRHASDRYANMEVSYLLQRLEQHRGLVIVASNLRDQLDAAFTRRFQTALHFARPAEPERRRMWERAFPAAAPVGDDVDRDALARLDMTCAAIVSSARTAALYCARDEAPAITMAHVVRAVSRQFQRESRLLRTSELGAHAHLLEAEA